MRKRYILFFILLTYVYNIKAQIGVKVIDLKGIVKMETVNDFLLVPDPLLSPAMDFAGL